MAIDPRLEEILLSWEEERANGRSVSIESLCGDAPELVPAARRLIAQLERVDGLLEGPREPAPEDDASRFPEEIAAVSRYRVLRRHARGGLGEIFVALDCELGREVALKLIQRPFDRDPGLQGRFLREAEITARLGHPGIVPVFGLGQTGDGRPGYAMRYIEGETLRAAIARFHDAARPDEDRRTRTLAFRGLLARLTSVCQAVAFAHSRGVIHRDLKPENIMLGPFGETLVVDWGLARRWKEGESPDPEPESVSHANPARDEALTSAGSTLGTPAYMSPEQAAGQWDEVGPASDVYSLGATLYGLLTGRPPFSGTSRAALLQRVRLGDFPHPRVLKPDVPRDLEAVCLKAMALQPSDRYASPLELAADLDRWLADEPVSACREPITRRLGRWARRHRPLVAGIAALGGTAIVALAVSTVLLTREQAKTADALKDARAGHGLARTTMSDVQTSFGLAAAARRNPAEAALWFAEAARVADLDRARGTHALLRVRAFALEGPVPVARLSFPDQDDRDRRRPQIRSMSFGGNGRYLAALTQRGACLVHDLQTDRPVPLAEVSPGATAIAWGGPANDLLAVSGLSGAVVVLRLPDGARVDRLSDAGDVVSLAFLPDGRRLAIGGIPLRIRDVSRGADARGPLEHPQHVVQTLVSPKGDRLATVAVDGLVRLYDVDGPASGPRVVAGPSALSAGRRDGKRPIAPRFVNDGRGLVLLATDNTLSWIDTASGAEVRKLPTGLTTILALEVSPDGRWLVAAGNAGVRVWETASGRQVGAFGAIGYEVAAFLPDSSELLLATGHHDALTLSVPGGEPGDWTLRVQDQASQVAVSPDGRLFALAQDDGLVRIWKFPERETGRRLVGVTASIRFATSAAGYRLMPLGRYLPSGPRGTSVDDWDTGKAGPALDTGGVLHGGALSPDGRRAVTLSSPPFQAKPGAGILLYAPGSQTGTVRFWDSDLGKEVLPAVETPSEPVGAAFRPDGQRLVIACARGELLWIDPATGRVLHQEGPGRVVFDQGVPQVELLRFSPDGRTLAVWGARPLTLHDTETGLPRSPEIGPELFDARRRVVDAHFSADGRYLVSAAIDKTARVWDVATGHVAAPPLVHPDWVFSATFSRDGNQVLTGCRDAAARVWDWRSSRLASPPLPHQGEVQFAAFLNDDRWVLTKSSDRELSTSTDNAVQIWERHTSRPLTPRRLVPSGWGCQIEVLPDGRHVAMGSNTGRVQVLDLARWLDPSDPRFLPPNVTRTTELYAGQKVVEGSSLTTLTSAEWSARWDAVRASARADPPSPPLGPPPAQ